MHHDLAQIARLFELVIRAHRVIRILSVGLGAKDDEEVASRDRAHDIFEPIDAWSHLVPGERQDVDATSRQPPSHPCRLQVGAVGGWLPIRGHAEAEKDGELLLHDLSVNEFEKLLFCNQRLSIVFFPLQRAED